MFNQPDIIVRIEDQREPALVVEVKTSEASPSAADWQLRSILQGMGCSTGLLVTPRRLRLYHNEARQGQPPQVDVVGGDLDSEIFGAVENSISAAERVQRWLEELPNAAERLERLPKELRAAMERLVLPVLRRGKIHAGGARSSMYLKADELPGLSSIVKEDINAAMLGLYRAVNPRRAEVAYILHESPGRYYLLDRSGALIPPRLDRQGLRGVVDKLGERLRFSEEPVAPDLKRKKR